MRAKRIANFTVRQTISDGRLKISQLATAIVTIAAEPVGKYIGIIQQVSDSVGQLNLAARPSAGIYQFVEDFWRQKVAAYDGKV